MAKRNVPDEYVPPAHRQLMASHSSWFIPPPYGWRHPVTGRHGWEPDPLLLAFGQYVKRGRYLARKTQQELADESRVDQGQISRLERALAPSMHVDRVVRLAGSLGRMLPLGYCPHEHPCPWQPARPPPPEPPFDRLSPAMRAVADEALRRELEAIAPVKPGEIAEGAVEISDQSG